MPDRTRTQRMLDRLPIWRNRPLRRGATAITLVAVAAGLRALVHDRLPPGYPFLTFFPVVALSAVLFGRRTGIVVALLSGLVAWYWFIPPVGLVLTQPTAMAIGFYALVVAIELGLIHLMQVTITRLGLERERSARLAETQTLLFRELQHRVSNNLQVTAALLTLQRQKLADGEARAALDEASRRLGLVGRISRRLYDPSGHALAMDEFIRTLAEDLMDAHGRQDIQVAVAADADARMKPDAAVPMALILAEAVANAVEHGIGDTPGGRIHIGLVRDGSGLSLRVADNGAGLSPDFRIDGNDSLGLRIARTLARQLDGQFDLRNRDDGPGTVAELRLPHREDADA